MLRRNIPLNTLRTFDAVARHTSFIAAAAELSISQSAVSQQIRSLERALGVPLFARLTRGVAPTDAGAVLARATRAALGELGRAIHEIRGNGPPESFSIGALTSFASRWLARRIAAFCAAHPELEVSVFAMLDPREMEQHQADIAILYGDGSWKGHLTEEIFREYIFPVCHPRLLQQHPLKSLDDLVRLPLLRDADPKHDYWPGWLAAAGVDHAKLSRGPRFDNLSDMITASVHGQGIALVRSALVIDEIEQGSLVRLFDIDFRAQYSYYLVWPKEAGKPELTSAFRQWLLTELQGTPGVLASPALGNAADLSR